MPGGPIIQRLSDPAMPWQRVKAQRNADGTESSVWEKWFACRADPAYLSLYARYDAGMVVRRHGHRSPHVVFVLEGEILVGDERCEAGTHIELPSGEQFGPLVAGEAGCALFEVMLGDPRSWSDDPDAFEQACSERGIAPLPDPEIDFPDWLEDERGRWIDSLQAGSDPENGADSLAGSDPEDGADSLAGSDPEDGADSLAGSDPEDGADSLAGSDPEDGADSLAGSDPEG